MKHVAFVAPGLGNGGVERWLSNLIPLLLRRGWQVTLVTQDLGANDYFPLPAGCHRVRLAADAPRVHLVQALRRNLASGRALRRCLRQLRPDVVVSSLTRTNVRTLLATRGLGMPVVVTEHACLGERHWAWRTLVRCTYPWAALLVAVSHGLAESFAWLRKVPREGLYNLILVPDLAPATEVGTRPYLVWMGRFSPEKNPALMLSAFHLVSRAHPEVDLWMLGEGALESDLRRQTEALGLQGRVHFAGHLAEPFGRVRQARALVATSNEEGFGNVLAEAQLLGVPVVSTDCPFGPREILDQGRGGWLVPVADPVAMADAVHEVLSDPEQTARRARHAKVMAEARFSEAAVGDRWDVLLADVMERNRGWLP